MSVIAHAIPRSPAAPGLAALARFNGDRLAFLRETADHYGDAAMLRVGPRRVLLVHAPRFFQAVLVEHGEAFRKGPLVFKAFRFAAGENLFTLEGDPHRRHRRLMAPALTPRHIAAYAETMVAHAERTRQAWADGAMVDVGKMSTALTLIIAAETLFGAPIGDAAVFGDASATITEYLNHLTRRVVTAPSWWPTPRNRRAHRTLALLHGRIQAMIAARRNVAERDAVASDLLSLLINARDEDGRPLSAQEVVNEATAILGAGHETVAKALTWALYELARHPHSLAAVHAEIDTAVRGRRPAYNDLPRLPYTLQVIKETLRLYPPAYVTTRQALRDLWIEGHHIPRGTRVFLCIYTLHRRAEVYPQPEVFMPERFCPEQERGLPRHAFLPFGSGAHVCIGNHFALMQLHLVLATLLQQHTLTLPPGPRIEPMPAFVLQPSRAVEATFTKRLEYTR